MELGTFGDDLDLAEEHKMGWKLSKGRGSYLAYNFIKLSEYTVMWTRRVIDSHALTDETHLNSCGIFEWPKSVQRVALF